MSVFDILRYQSTDLSSRHELETLPQDLILEYWIRAHEKYPEEYRPSHSTMCKQLAQWGVGDGLRGSKENHYAREIFNKVLKEYNP